MVSFIMYLDFLGCPQPPFKNPRYASEELFFAKDGVLYDLREKRNYLERLTFRMERNRQNLQDLNSLKNTIQKNAEDINDYEKVIESLNKKRKKE